MINRHSNLFFENIDSKEIKSTSKPMKKKIGRKIKKILVSLSKKNLKVKDMNNQEYKNREDQRMEK